MPSPPPERREPLPGLFGLPRHLFGKLSHRGRRIVGWGLALAALALVLLAAVLVPEIQDTRRGIAADERRAERANRAERRREVLAEQRPRSGRAQRPGLIETLRALRGAIVADIARRVDRGEIDVLARRAECALDTPRAGGERLVSCTAVTSDIAQSELSSAGTVGYPYLALADPRSGRFTFCKIAGRAAEGGLRRDDLVPVPRACGG